MAAATPSFWALKRLRVASAAGCGNSDSNLVRIRIAFWVIQRLRVASAAGRDDNGSNLVGIRFVFWALQRLWVASAASRGGNGLNLVRRFAMVGEIFGEKLIRGELRC